MTNFNRIRNFLYNAEPALAKESRELLGESRAISNSVIGEMEREHAALVAVAEAASHAVRVLSEHYGSDAGCIRLVTSLDSALANLAAVRGESEGGK